MSKKERDEIITAMGPSDSPNEYYGGKFIVRGLWFTHGEMEERFELVGRKDFPKRRYATFAVKPKTGRK